MSSAREIKQLQKAKVKAQNSKNLKEEANLCNQLGELLARSGNFQSAIEEHRQELALSDVLQDVIGCAVANRKIGECFAELGNIEAALKHQQRHLDLARSVDDAAEEQRALATIGRTFLFRYESDQSDDSLRQAENAFKKSLAIVEERLEGSVPARELSEMRARLFLNLGFVYDEQKDLQRCSDYIRRSVYIAEKNQLLEDLFRANFNLGRIHFRNGHPSKAVRCLEQAKECARKMKDKFMESDCFSSIGKVLLSVGDFVAARRSLKKAYKLGSQQPGDRDSVKKALRQAIQGCHLEQAALEADDGQTQQALGLAEQLGDLYCKVGCYRKALEAYHLQLSSAVSLGKPARELAVIHVSLAATYSDLRQYHKAVEHYRQEVELRRGNPKEECGSWLNIAVCLEENGNASPEELDNCYSKALCFGEAAGHPTLQRRVLRLWLAVQQRTGSPRCDETSARLAELCAKHGWTESDEDEEEEEEENSEPQDDSDIPLSDSDEDLEEYNKLVPGCRRMGRWNKRNEKGETCLHRACIDGNFKQVQYLVEQGHPINPRDYCGWTPLHEACNHGHMEIVSLLLDRGANVNDPGGPLCDGVTPLHDSLSCGHFQVAQMLVQRGANVNLQNAKGQTPLDCLRQWLKTYSRELDQETRHECAEMEKILQKARTNRKAVSIPTAPQTLLVLQDSQLFDAENSEPLQSNGGCRVSCQNLQEVGKAQESRRRRGIQRRRQQGTEYDSSPHQIAGSSSDNSDSDSSISPLRPVRPRLRAPESLSPAPVASLGRDSPDYSGPSEYQRAIRALGSASARRCSLESPELQFTSTPAVVTSETPALVPEDEYVADDWLENDMPEMQPKKRRRMGEELERRQENTTPVSVASLSVSHRVPTTNVSNSSRRGLSLPKGVQKSRQVKMTQLSGMVLMGRREVSRSESPTQEEVAVTHTVQPIAVTQNPPPVMPAPIRMRVRVQDNVFLIPVPHSEADSCSVSWLCQQAAQRYYQACGLLPRLSLHKDGALLSSQDLLLAVLQTNEEVVAEVCSWDLPPLPQRYKKACQSLTIEVNALVCRICETQDSSTTVSLCGLSLPPPGLTPLLRALKLQSILTELRLARNRLSDNLMPEVIAAVATMPKLRILDLSANRITGEGLQKAAATLESQTTPVFPSLEELCLSMNSLGDEATQPLSCLLSACPLLTTLSLQACDLSARFLQHHRLLLANTLTGIENLKSVCLSHNALGTAGVELALKTLPLHTITHLYLSGVRASPAEPLCVNLLTSYLSQDNCSLIHVSLAGNGLSNAGILSLARCLPVCPNLVSLDLSANPAVTSAGLSSLVSELKRTQKQLTCLNLQGCKVCGPWEGLDVDGLAAHVNELHLCSKALSKVDQETLLKSWEGSEVTVFSKDGKCFIKSTNES